ncbi:TadE/TadG family type IV pilus assembly protein [Frigidibacter sp. ROC022]|uniref:TadE/TadG family type IV pilus assembly protein n=1 Tax=Frigidibacter sp. ROC022 TaxID=2971796 RepID=UPI00215ACE03|nr:hypothetical protein [Frigidibacter sp. ROC022]MCR8723679.1 hypothetical protein [Frigidibacter sp. ROC022]
MILHPFHSLRRRLRSFADDTRGMLSVEAAIAAPLLVFFLSLMYVTFDIFRIDATNSKAAYTIGDLLSRETEEIDQDFIDGMKGIFDYITLANADDTWIRVSVVRYDGDDEEFKLVWSQGNTGVESLTQDTLDVVEGSIPDMAEEDTVIVVETYMPYEMPLRVGLADFAYKNVVITRPRFSGQLLWTSS